MGIPPSDARRLSLWEYEAMLTNHNIRTNPDGAPVKAPDKAKVARALERLSSDRRFTH